VSFPFAAVRALHFISLMMLFGAAAFLWLLHAFRIAGPPKRTFRTLFPVVAALSLATGVLWFILVAGNMAGNWRAGFDGAMLTLVATKTEFGQIALWRLAGLGFLCVLCQSPARERPGLLACFAAILLAALGFTSHAAAAEGAFPLLRAGNDALHLLTAGFWVGGLMVLAALVALCQPRELIEPFRLFSRVGTIAVALLVVSGVVNAASILPASAMMSENAYTGLLAVKIALAISMIGLAVVNRIQLVPTLGTVGGAVIRQLGLSVLAEIVLGTLIIVLVGYLGQMAPG
jgi:copper resistance protein D